MRARAAGQPYAIIITDQPVSAVDGIKVVRMLSSVEKGQQRSDAENAGIDHFLTKPIKLQELSVVVDAIAEEQDRHGRSGVSETGP